MYTLDASVFLNAFDRREPGSPTSRQLLRALRQRREPIIEPALLLPELAGPLRRGGHDPALARSLALAVAAIPHLRLVPLDDTIARIACNVAADRALRGADAVYAAVTQHFATTLVTLDKEQFNRLSLMLSVQWPADALAALSPSGTPPAP